MNIRQATVADTAAIQEILVDAFEGTEEAHLVTRLEAADLMLEELSLIALIAEQPIGYLLFTKMSIKSGDGTITPAIAVAPLGIKKEYQSRGIGTALMERGLSLAKERGHRIALLLGNPIYYHRFGFQTALDYGIASPFEVDPVYFMVKFLQEKPDSNISGMATYPMAWNE